RDGKLRLDRTVDVSVTNAVEKRQIMSLLGPNLATLSHLLRSNRRDFLKSISKSTPLAERRAAWRRLVRRRYKAVRLVEELGLRTQRLHPLMDTAAQISRRMQQLLAEIARLRAEHADEAALLAPRRELRQLMLLTMESPTTLRKRVERVAGLQF